MEYKNIVLGIIIIGVLMVSIDSTIVLLAFPSMIAALHSSISVMIWVIIVYLLVSAVSATQFGKIGDIYGRSRIFNIGFGIFTVASLLCGLATNDVSLILFRIVQAVGGAMMQSNSGAIIADLFEKHNIGKAYGFTALGWNVGAILGIVLGGIITTFFGYRYIFFINVPIGIVAVILGIKYIHDDVPHKQELDLSGMVLFGLGIGVASFGALEIASIGASILNIIITLIGILLIVAFFVFDSKKANPVLDIKSITKNRIFRNSVLASFMQGMGYIGAVFLIIMYLQGVRDLSPLNASLLLIPGYVIGGVLAPFMGKYSDKFGARILATIGILMMIFGIMVYYTLGLSTTLYVVIIGTILSGIGSAMFFPANSSAAMANADSKLRGSSFGLLRLMSSLGFILSFVIIFLIMSLVIPRSLAFEIFVGTSKITASAGAAFVSSMHAAFIGLIFILIVAGLLSLTRGRENRNSAQNATHAQPA